MTEQDSIVYRGHHIVVVYEMITSGFELVKSPRFLVNEHSWTQAEKCLPGRPHLTLGAAEREVNRCVPPQAPRTRDELEAVAR